MSKNIVLILIVSLTVITLLGVIIYVNLNNDSDSSSDIDKVAQTTTSTPSEPSLTPTLPQSITRQPNEDNDMQYDKVIKKEEFELKLKFDKRSKNWEYKIVGYVPNPCYKVEEEIITAESYPEQVYVTLHITPPSREEVCTQVIKDIEILNTFQASKEAIINFNIV